MIIPQLAAEGRKGPDVGFHVEHRQRAYSEEALRA